MEQEASYHFAREPPQPHRGFEPYHVAHPCSLETFLSATINAQTPNPTSYFGDLPSFLRDASDLPPSHNGMTCQAPGISGVAFFDVAVPALGVPRYDTSSVESWSPITPATPGTSEGLPGRLPATPGAFCFHGSTSPSQTTVGPLSEGSWIDLCPGSSHEPSQVSTRFADPVVEAASAPRPLSGLPYQVSIPNVTSTDTKHNPQPDTPPPSSRVREPSASTATKKRGSRKKKQDAPVTLRKKPGRKAAMSRHEQALDTMAPGHTLRTAPRKSKGVWSTSRAKTGETTAQRLARTNHNRAEKEYRDRLHGGFAKLLEVLPEEDLSLDDLGEGLLYMHHDVVRRRREMAELREQLEKLEKEVGGK